ncbi:MAG: hypothetical protein HFI63_04090, partial [Lachnospiraceae bacterium]|nr:hypothetical protein [Lachnospiraceae bacterium]
MKGWKRRFLGFLMVAMLTVSGMVSSVEAHPQVTNVMMTFPDGWRFHYADGHTSQGGYFHVRETGELLFCVEPHVNEVMSSRDHWVTLTQYFGDAAFADRIGLIAYYGENSGWGIDGWAAAQSLIWKEILQRNGESGEQWISTTTLTSREQLQDYYHAIEEKVAAYYRRPGFDGETITLEAGQSREVVDANGVLDSMEVTGNGPIQVSKDGNRLLIIATGTEAGTGQITLKKPLPGGIEGENFVYTDGSRQDLMTSGAYAPIYASLSVNITEAPVSMTFSKEDAATGRKLPGAGMKVTDEGGNLIDAWTSGTEPHPIRNLKNGRRYTLTETSPAPGYATAEPISFTASHGAAPVVMKDEMIRIDISKTDLTTGKELPGATLQVTDQAGKVIDKWVSGTKPHRITKLVAGRRYTLTETIPAAGYATAESVTFTVSDTGEVQKVELHDDITKVEISKTDLTTGKELPGATLQVTDQAGKVIDKWVSG